MPDNSFEFNIKRETKLNYKKNFFISSNFSVNKNLDYFRGKEFKISLVY